MNERASGQHGIWYANAPQEDAYRYTYRGGFATHAQQIIPHAVCALAVSRVMVCYGGRSSSATMALCPVKPTGWCFGCPRTWAGKRLRPSACSLPAACAIPAA